MHGGRLDAQSAGAGQGSTFLVRLPEADMADGHGTAGKLSGFKVLVVDDNRDSADSATAVIRLLGHEAQAAYDGAGALELARRFPADMVMLDLSMPGMDGFQTLARLREVPGREHAFVVAMTGYGGADDKRRTSAAGFDAHLTKPVELNALNSLLNQARQRG